MSGRSEPPGPVADTPIEIEPAAETQDVVMEDVSISEEERRHHKRCALLSELNVEYDWSYIKEETLDDTTGVISRSSLEPSLSDEIFYEILLCAKFYPERLSKDRLVALLEDLMDDNHIEALKSRFVAVLNTFKIDSSIVDLLKEYKRLPALEVACNIMEDSVITDLELIRRYKDKKVDYLIRNLVDQRRYNVLHESSEGYAKVISLLTDACASDFSKYEIPVVIKGLETCIGHFNLDPTMVLDIIIGAGAEYSSTNYRFWVDLLQQSRFWPKNSPANSKSLGTLNDGGNDHAARLLAARLRLLSSGLKDELKPDLRLHHLSNFACMLIKCGFISFGGLYKLIGPDHEGVTKLTEKVREDIEGEIFKASANALALSGPLADEEENGGTKPPLTQEKEEVEQPPFSIKSILLKAVLANGLYHPSVYILSVYPELAFADDEIPQLINRLFREMLKPMASKLQILTDEQSRKLRTPGKSFQVKDTQAVNELDSAIKCKTATDVYFYREWSSDLPKINNVDDLIRYANEFLTFAGARLGEDFQLVSSLSKIGLNDLANGSNGDDEKLNLWFEFFRKFILPASTYGHENPIAVFDTYQLLKLFPLEWRYNLYGEMQKVMSKNIQYVKLNYSKAEKQTKDVLKRLTTENIKQTMRRLSKITFANPLPAFSVITSQVESYDNLTDLVVDAARYFTDYAWDVLPFVLLTRLTQRRQAIQSDGVNDATWLQSLSTFIAKLAKHYTAFNLEPILQFSVRCLHQGDSVGLTLLKQLIAQLGGIQRFTNLVPHQIKFLNCGPSLQKVARKVIMDTRDSSKRSGERLLRSFVSAGVLSEIFVLTYHFHKSVIDKADDDTPFKILTERSDESAAVLHTFSQLLNFFHSGVPDLFEKKMIPVNELIKKYNVGISWTYELWRAHISLDQVVDVDYSCVDFSNLSRVLYADFWKLGLYDINFDADLYSKELIKLETQNKTIANEIRISQMDRKDRDDIDNVKLRKRLESDSSFNKGIINSLPVDKDSHRAHSETVSRTLESRRASWFSSENPTDVELEAFIQFCVVPRVLHSETDAVFAGSFVTTQLSTELSTLVLDKIFQSLIIGTLLFTATPVEAENIGLFVAEVIGQYQGDETSNDSKKSAFHWLQSLILPVKENLLYSENYMSRRNTLTFLKTLIPVARVKTIGIALHSIVERVSKLETREDLNLACSAVFALLQNASKHWIDVWDAVEFDEDEKIKLQKEIAKHNKRQQILKDMAKRASQKKADEERAARVALIQAEDAKRAVQRAEEEAARLKEEEEKAAADALSTKEKEDASENDEGAGDDEGDEDKIIIEEDEEIEQSNTAVSVPNPKESGLADKDVKIKDDVKDEVEGRKEKSLTKKDDKEDNNEDTSGNLKKSKETDKEDNIKRDDSKQLPPKPAARVSRFQNVTGSQTPLTGAQIQDKIDTIHRVLKTGDLEQLVKATSDHPLTTKRLRENTDGNRKYRNNLRTILADYVNTFGSGSVISTSRLYTEIGNFPLPGSLVGARPTGKRAPLPDQSSVVLGRVGNSDRGVDGVRETRDREAKEDRERRDREAKDARERRDREAKDARDKRDRDSREIRDKRDKEERERRERTERERRFGEEREKRNSRDTVDLRQGSGRDGRFDDRGRNYRGGRNNRDDRPPPPPPPPPSGSSGRDYDRKRTRQNDYGENKKRRGY